jgi:hypothetical protein
MSVFKPVIYDGMIQRQMFPGDVMGGGEILNALTTVGAGTLTGALLTSGIINRTGPVGGFTDTTDSAANIIAALIAQYSYQQSPTNGISSGNAIQPGLTFRLRYINTVAFAMTLAAGTGVTITANGNVNASSVKDYLLTVLNGTPQQVFAANQTSGSAVITGLTQFQTSLLSVGQLVTGTNIPGGASVISVQQGVGVTLSANATATLSLNALTFAPSVSIVGLGQGLL